MFNQVCPLIIDFQKLEREARICRKLQHPNIGKSILFLSILCVLCDRFNRDYIKTRKSYNRLTVAC